MKSPRSLVAIALAVAACRPSTRPSPAAGPTVSVIPAPMSLTLSRDAAFVIRDSTAIVVDAPNDSARRVADLLAFQLRPPTGFALPIVPGMGGTPRAGIRLRIDASRADVGDEGYALVVRADSVHLVARTPAGLFHGIQTIRQLLPYQIEAENAETSRTDWRIPSLDVVDRPRFAWRGAMLDVARHFFTVDEVKQYVDILAMYKMNTLHLHLADDQGWRIEIKSRPELLQGAATQVGGGPGGFYTQAEYGDIVRYAAERFIAIVPEIDMPAHTNALLVSHPELSCGKRPPALYTGTEVGFSALCPDKEETYRLLDDIVREIAAMTPGPYFHIGGDEVQALTHEQYARFIERVQDIVTKNGKRMVGWEEISRARLNPTTLSQTWFTDSARSTLASGVKLIMSPASKVYIDMKYDDNTELGLKWAGLVEVRTSYDWDPATYVKGATEADVVGVEAPLWAETIRNITAAQQLIMPRLPAIAEVGWTPQGARRWEDFRLRLAPHARRWRLLGINYYPSPQIAW
jgi:hexosaminidase